MSNNYNSTLQTNNTDLQAILNTINELPEAGTNGTDTSDATATASEIFAGETAYVAEGKVTGTFTIEEELSAQDNLISQISTLVAQKANPPSTDTADATATASDILSGKTAYARGEKITGTYVAESCSTVYIGSTVPTADIGADGAIYIVRSDAT